jgi:hypothetical protein
VNRLTSEDSTESRVWVPLTSGSARCSNYMSSTRTRTNARNIFCHLCSLRLLRQFGTYRSTVDVLKQLLGNGQMCKFSALIHIILPMRSPSEPTCPDIRPRDFFGHRREATELERRGFIRHVDVKERNPRNFLCTVTCQIGCPIKRFCEIISILSSRVILGLVAVQSLHNTISERKGT